MVVTDPADERRRDGPADLGRLSGQRAGPIWTRSRSPSPATRPPAPGFWLPPRWCWRTRRNSGSGARRCSARWSRCCRSPTRPRPSALANDTDYGLSGSIFTADLGRALRVSRAIQSGNLSVNSHSSVRYWTPFGGYKQSGLGRELGPDAPDAFTEEKNVFFAIRPWSRRRMTGRVAGPRGRGHRRLFRDRPGQRAPAGRGGRARRDRRRRRGPRTRGRRRGRRPVPPHRRDQRGRRTRAVRRRRTEAYGSVDIAFNNAGISPPEDDSILATELDAWRRVQEVNLTSVYLCCKAALPYMMEQGRGSIINTASFVAVLGAATSQISYSASKGGVLSLSRELGVQFARRGDPGQRPLSRPGQHPVAAGAVRLPIRSGPRDGWCTSRWAGSPSRRRSPTRYCSWPPTSPASSPPARSWSTGASVPPTSLPMTTSWPSATGP